MSELLRLLTLIWTEVLAVIAGQRTIVQAINRLYDIVTGADLLGALAGMQSDVTTIKGEIQDSGHGLQAIVDKLDLLTVNDTLTLQTVLDAVNPVTLPASPPPGYGGASAADVWAETYQTTGLTFADLVARAGYWAWALTSGFNWPAAGSPGFVWFGNMVTPRTNPPPNVGAEQPQVDWSLWVKGGDLVAFLQANEQYYNWEADVDGSPIADTGLDLGGGNTLMLRCLMPVKLLDSGALTGLPPIWPGEDGVTLGTPVVLTETDIVAGPMDGILLTVDSGPGGAGQWGVDTFRSYYRAGYVVFLDADGHADTTQFVGPDDNVFAPKGMTTAASVVVGLNKATQITVTPWTLGAPPPEE